MTIALPCGLYLRALAQCRQRKLGAEKHAREVDGAEPVPIGERRLLDAHAEKDASIVDEDVEAAETVGDGRDRRGPILLAGNVETRVDRLGPGTLDRSCGFPAALIEHIANCDLCSGLGHEARSLRANAARCPGNQSYLAVETVHCGHLWSTSAGTDAPAPHPPSPAGWVPPSPRSRRARGFSTPSPRLRGFARE